MIGGGLVTLERAKVYAIEAREEANKSSSRAERAISRDADWKMQVFTLEVTSDGGRTGAPNDYILKRSAEEHSNCYRRELLQCARRKAADETRGSACRVSSKNSGADYK